MSLEYPLQDRSVLCPKQTGQGSSPGQECGEKMLGPSSEGCDRRQPQLPSCGVQGQGTTTSSAEVGPSALLPDLLLPKSEVINTALGHVGRGERHGSTQTWRTSTG